MKRKGLAIAGLVAGLSVLSSMSAFAGQWIQEERGWWWQNDDGSYPVSTWKWIDGDKNGNAECYYFDSEGWLVTNTTIDGRTVNADGAWTENGFVHVQPDLAHFESISNNETIAVPKESQSLSEEQAEELESNINDFTYKQAVEDSRIVIKNDLAELRKSNPEFADITDEMVDNYSEDELDALVQKIMKAKGF